MFRPIEYLEWIAGRVPEAAFDLGSSDLRAARPAVSNTWPALDDPRGALKQALATAYGVEPANVLVTAGATHANFLAMATAIGDGADVLVEKPGYEPLVATSRALGGRVHRFTRPAADDFSLEPARIDAAANDDTALIVLTNRHNPSGSLADRESISAAAQVAADVDAILLVDEVYAPFVEESRDGPFGGTTAAGLANTVVTGSLTKFFGLGSLRIGWLVGPTSFVERARSVGWHVPVVAESNVALAAELLQDTEAMCHRSRSVATQNHEQLASFVDAQPRVEGLVAPGATYAFLNHRDVDGDAVVDAAWERGILVVPGRFFDDSERFRVSLGHDSATNRATLDAFANVLADF